MRDAVRDLVQQRRNTTAVSAIAGHREKLDTLNRPTAHGMPAADTNREANAMNPDTERELATLRAEVVLLRSQIESATILLASGTKLLTGLQDHRDALLKAIRWHRDQIQAPGRPEARRRGAGRGAGRGSHRRRAWREGARMIGMKTVAGPAAAAMGKQ